LREACQWERADALLDIRVFLVTSPVDGESYSIPALPFVQAQVRLLEPGKILCCNEDEKPKQNHCCDVRAHVRAILDDAAILFEFREIKHVQDIVGLHIINLISAVSRSLSKRYDISPLASLIGPHLAPQATIRFAIGVSMIRPDPR
jgi:hypothetical protein